MEHIISYGIDLFYIGVLDRLGSCILSARIRSKRRRILMLTIFILFYDMISYFFYRIKIFMVCAGIVWHFAIFSILYRGNIKMNIIMVLFITMANMLSEVILFHLFSSLELWNINVNEMPMKYALTGSAASKIIIFTFLKLFILIYKIADRKKLSKYENTVNISFYDCLETIIVPGTTIVILMFMVSNAEISRGWTFICLALLAVNIFSYDQYNRLQVNTVNADLFSDIKELYEMSRQYADDVNMKWQELRCLRHDIKKDYMLEMMYLSTGELEKLKKHYQDIISMNIFHSGETGNRLIDMIIKQAECKAGNSGVRCVFDIQIPVDMYFDEYKINRLLGNLIDNGIEAASGYRGCDRWLKLVIRIYHNNMYIECSNSCRITDKEKYAIDNQKTTKKNKMLHGYGMKIIRQITDLYNGIIEIEYESDIYKIKILLCNVEISQCNQL